MSDRLLRIRIRPIGAETVTRAVRGITQSARQAQRAQEQAERATTREAQQSARTREAVAQREARERARAAQQAATAQSRAAAQASRDEQRALRDTTRAQQRELRVRRQADARAARESRRRWQQAGAIGGALLGAGRAVMGRVQGYQAATGMPTRDQLVGSYLERQRSTIRLARQGGVSTSDLNGRIDSTARATGVDQSQLIEGLQYAQETLASPDFNALDVFSRHLEEIANASYATGAPVEDLIGALGQMRSQFGITEDDFGSMIGTMVEMAANGSIEVGDLAANFTAEMAQFRQLRSGVTGVEAAREFAGTAEVIGRQTPGSPEEAATAFRGVMSSLGNGRVRRGIEAQLRRGGLSREQSDVFDDRTGALSVSMPELVSRMRAGHLDTAAAFDTAGIHNVRAQAGFRALLGTSAEEYGAIVNSSSQTGNRTIADTNRELRASDAGHANQARVDAQANFQKEGAGVVHVMLEAASAATELETRFPALTEAMGALSDVMGGLGLGSIIGGAGVSSLLTGGGSGGIAGMLGLGGAATTGGTAATGGLAGLASGAGALALPTAIVAGTLDFMRGTAGETAQGDAVGATQADALRSRSGGLDAAAAAVLTEQRQGMSPSDGAQLQRQVQAQLASGVHLTPETIRALAAAIGPAVGREIPTPAPSGGPPRTAPPDLRVPRGRRPG